MLQCIQSLRTADGPSFSADEVREEAGLRNVANRRTVARVLHRNGYKKRQLRRKGLLTANDRKLRVAYARKLRRDRDQDFFKNKMDLRNIAIELSIVL